MNLSGLLAQDPSWASPEMVILFAVLIVMCVVTSGKGRRKG